jgi:sulfate permease, SulP family
MAAEITAKGIRFQAVEARVSVRDRLRSKGIEVKFGSVNRFTSVADAVEGFQQAVRMDIGTPAR